MVFEDHFSKQAADYARFRPTYPDELYDFILCCTTGRDLAWDCGTGNGQAARGLATYFKQVYATDPSACQIAEAPVIGNVAFSIGAAEYSGLAAQSVDLVTSAQAAHWFDHARFDAEVRRVLKPGGTICLWTYKDPLCQDSAVAEALHWISRQLLGDYWPKSAKDIFQRYREMPFPYQRISTPDFTITASMTFEQVFGYLSSWSATQAFLDADSANTLGQMHETLGQAWGERTQPKSFSFAMFVLLGTG